MESYVPNCQGQQVIPVSLIYPALYNGPVNYFARLVREKDILLEQFDSYTKQTYRNRCMIMGPNGVLTLSIPVKKKRGVKHLKEIRIDYDTPWNKNHWRSLVASYASSPFFEYFMDDLIEFYENKFEFLIDLNQQLIERTLQLLGIKIQVSCSASFNDITSETDPRSFIHPKKDPAVVDHDFKPVVYHQVFSDRMGFKANLSILDLLFNEGPAALSILQKSLRT
ncbi:MAG: WbqC family protein [Bacteroidota bacterium]